MSIQRIQLLLWVFIWAILFSCFLLEGETLIEALTKGSCDCFFYAFIIYFNVVFLILFVYHKKGLVSYILLSLLFLAGCTFFRVHLQHYFNTQLFTDKPFSKPILFRTYSYIFFSHVLVFLTSIGFRLGLDFFKVQKQKEQLQKQQALIELSLLKAQVQPHFLFNTLNNIYAVAEREASTTAGMIEQLANIMRYFTNESHKETIDLQTELDFINNYIALEKMRMRFPLMVEIEIAIQEKVILSPMLILPLIENVFKHGIDKRKHNNYLHFSVVQQEKILTINIVNNYYGTKANTAGTGLVNLHNRLKLLYRDSFHLKTYINHEKFYTHLNIPI